MKCWLQIQVLYFGFGDGKNTMDQLHMAAELFAPTFRSSFQFQTKRQEIPEIATFILYPPIAPFGALDFLGDFDIRCP